MPMSAQPASIRVQERTPECLVYSATHALPIHAVRPAALPELLDRLPPSQAGFVRACGFAAKAGQTVLLAGGDAGLGGAVLGLGEGHGPHVFGSLPAALPSGTVWRLSSGFDDPAAAVLGYALGAYRFELLRQPTPACAQLLLPDDAEMSEAVSAARATWLVRDLINMPANLLGPTELATTACGVLGAAGAHAEIIEGTALAQRFPVVEAVGAGSMRPPAVVVAHWAAEGAGVDAPLISLCGKGVCFDTGGYDLKPSSGMLRMKKDMGGAAVALGLARMVIDARLPIRLELRLGCVENMVSGTAMRPLDILRTRRGVAIEVGNTDAEGRLVLCDLLAEAGQARPAALLDFATLTGAARAALGPDLPALFSNDDVLAELFSTGGCIVHDPVWRLPLWDGYNSWLDSAVADLTNVSEKAQAGAIVAALFLQRFVPTGVPWAHFDVYAWNDGSRPGLPAGGEAQAMRAAFAGLNRLVMSTKVEQ